MQVEPILAARHFGGEAKTLTKVLHHVPATRPYLQSLSKQHSSPYPVRPWWTSGVRQ